MDNKKCNGSFVTEIVLDDGRTFTYESDDDGYEFFVEEPFIMVKEYGDIIAMFNMNNVVSIIFD